MSERAFDSVTTVDIDSNFKPRLNNFWSMLLIIITLDIWWEWSVFPTSIRNINRTSTKRKSMWPRESATTTLWDNSLVLDVISADCADIWRHAPAVAVYLQIHETRVYVPVTVGSSELLKSVKRTLLYSGPSNPREPITSCLLWVCISC